MAIYGYMQRIGIKGLFQTNVTDGFQSFLGNSAYSAGVFMIGIILSAFIFLKSKNIYSKIFAIISFVLQFPAIVLSHIRGAQLGLIFSIFLNPTFWRYMYFTFRIFHVIFLFFLFFAFLYTLDMVPTMYNSKNNQKNVILELFLLLC